MKKIDITGQRFGRLIAEERTLQRRNGCALWSCRCDCGQTHLATASLLQKSVVRSCGCYQIDTVIKHGAKRRGLEHPLYRIWRGMRARCGDRNNSHYPVYGGRGIRVCDVWQKSFATFRDYMLALPGCPPEAQTPNALLTRTIDRRDSNKNYEPGNVRWADDVEQANNRTNNRMIRVNGVEIPMAEAVRRYGKASYGTIQRRLERGWSVRDAFLTPC